MRGEVASEVPGDRQGRNIWAIAFARLVEQARIVVRGGLFMRKSILLSLLVATPLFGQAQIPPPSQSAQGEVAVTI